MLKSLPEQEIFRIEIEMQALPGDSAARATSSIDVFLKPYRRKIAVAATRMASHCAEPGGGGRADARRASRDLAQSGGVPLMPVADFLIRQAESGRDAGSELLYHSRSAAAAARAPLTPSDRTPGFSSRSSRDEVGAVLPPARDVAAHSSPRSGRSILMTSAPASARIRVSIGPGQ
jgi:hypothetical protein